MVNRILTIVQETKSLYSAEVSESDLCDCNDAVIFLMSDISIIGCKLETAVAFNNCGLIIKCI